MYNAAITEVAKIAASTVGTVSSTPLAGGAVDMSKYHRVDFIISVGALNSTETADALVQTDTVSSFDDSAATLAQTTAEALNDNQVAIISIKSSDLPEGDRYARATATGSGATGGPGCILAIGYPRYAGADDGSPNVAGEIDAVVARVFA